MSRSTQQQSFQGLDSVPKLFAFAYVRALELLSGGDLAALHRREPGSLALLGWLQQPAIDDLAALLGALAAREPIARYRLRNPERARIREILGPDALDDGRSMFVLA